MEKQNNKEKYNFSFWMARSTMWLPFTSLLQVMPNGVSSPAPSTWGLVGDHSAEPGPARTSPARYLTLTTGPLHWLPHPSPFTMRSPTQRQLRSQEPARSHTGDERGGWSLRQGCLIGVPCRPWHCPAFTASTVSPTRWETMKVRSTEWQFWYHLHTIQ